MDKYVQYFGLVMVLIIVIFLIVYFSKEKKGTGISQERSIFIDKCVGAKKDNGNGTYSKKDCEDTFDTAMANLKNELLGE